jgi:hypothetical protein
MPNWCSNQLTLTHADTAQIKRAIEAYNADRLLSEFHPTPEELKNTTAPAFNEDPETAKALIEKYDFSNWYDWQVNNWGTKWDVSSVDELEYEDGQTEAHFYFDSAWAPPTEWYSHMEDLGFKVSAMYHEPGMAFCGIYEDGCDDQFELTGNADWVDKHIPKAINEAFAIAENMQMWEDEENEIPEATEDD